MNATVNKTVLLGGRIYALPFSTDGHWVVDARDYPVCEAVGATVAAALAMTMNKGADDVQASQP